MAGFDKVLVLDAGIPVEFDHPFKLLNSPNSIFRGLAKATGESNFNVLKKLAERHDKNMIS